MAGHSKWANIKHRKERQDAKRGKIWTRVIREITVAARDGADPASNSRMRLALDKATEVNMPKDTVQRAIQRGSGTGDGANYEEIRYEGYGHGGAAIIIECMTDNRVRTVAEVRHTFSKFGGNLGQDGCVSFLFDRCGHIVCAAGSGEDAVMTIALVHGAEDVSADAEGHVEVVTPADSFAECKVALEGAEIKLEFAEVVLKPQTEVSLSNDDADKLQTLLDALEDLDDIQDVHCNAVRS